MSTYAGVISGPLLYLATLAWLGLRNAPICVAPLYTTKMTCSSDGTLSHVQCIAQGDLGRHRFLQVSITFFVDHNTALAQGMISKLHCNLMPWFPGGQNCNCNKHFYSFLLSDSAFLVTAILYCSSPYAFPIYPLFVCLDVCVHHSRELWDLATALW